MYCKICGNLLNNDDSNCNVCGAVVATPVSDVTDKEEVVYNPPYSPFQKDAQDISHTGNEFFQGGATRETDAQIYKQQPDNDEFSWNVYDFPRSRKTETVEFTWKQDEFGNPIHEKTSLEQNPMPKENFSFAGIREDYFLEKSQDDFLKPELEEDIYDLHPRFETLKNEQDAFIYKKTISAEKNKISQIDNNSIPIEDLITDEDMKKIHLHQNLEGEALPRDKFFTFSKKNEEFQKLLDKEYARINELEQHRNAGTPVNPVSFDEKIQNPFQDNSLHENLQGREESPLTNSQKNSHLNEMEEARKMFFSNTEPKVAVTPKISTAYDQQNILLKNDEIKQKYQHEEHMAEDFTAPTQSLNSQPVNHFAAHDLKEELYQHSQPAHVSQQAANLAPFGQNMEAVPPLTDQMDNTAPIMKSTDTIAVNEFNGTPLERESFSNSDNKSRKLSMDFGHLEPDDKNLGEEFEDDFDDEDLEESKSKSGIAGKVILGIIIVLLLAELTILGIKFFLPESAATAFILEQEIIIVDAITNWINGIKGIFSK